MPTVRFVLNEEGVTASYEEGMSLLSVLREELGITSAKDGCSPEGYCGCCTVLVDGRPALACLKKPEHVEGKAVVTLDGLPERLRATLADAFVHEGAVQCGFCTPGILVRSASLLATNAHRSDEEITRALGSHLCRCTGYGRIAKAIKAAGAALETGMPVPPPDPGPTAVGKPAPRYRGREMALGLKPFVADLTAPGMLHGAFVLSAHPRARLLGVDASGALAMPGVKRVLTAADVPGERYVGLLVRDWPVFVAVGEETRCVGDVVAMVVADTQHRARAAARAVSVSYEALAPVTSPEEALRPGAPRLHEKGNLLEVCAFARGDVEKALASSAHVVRRRFETQRIEHAFLEPEACLAVPIARGAPERDERGGSWGGAERPPMQDRGVHLFSQGQGVHDDQLQVAAVLGVARESVSVELVATGGAFGGKEDLSVQAQTALAAFLLGVPVRTVLTREQSILLHPKRHPLTLDYTAGCDAEGRLTAVRARIVGDTGAYASVGAKVLERAAGHSCGPYRVPNVDVEALTVYTNNPPSGAMRGFGANQAAFAIEGVVDLLAEKAGLDRYEIRHRNVLRPGDRFATGQRMDETCGALATLEAVRDDFQNARFAGIACGIKNTGIGNGQQDIGRVKLVVHPGGSVEIRTGYTEMGQGLFTILAQIVSGETGIPVSALTVRTLSELSVLCGMTTASRATALAGAAAQAAARKLAEALKDRSLESLSGREFVGEMICDFTTKPGERTDDPVTHLTFGYATQVVILDEAGKVRKVVAAHDVGRAINPDACAGQIEGAVHMGLGYALSEELVVKAGRPVSPRLRDQGIVPAREMPEVEVRLIEVEDRVGGYGAKGVGEIGLVPTAAAVAGALEAFDGVRRTKLPMRDAPAAAGSLPRSRRATEVAG